jgi:hypothetical protein
MSATAGAFNHSANILQPAFNGDLCSAFKCQAANDPVFEGLSAKATIEARAGLAALNGATSYSFGNELGMAAKLSGLDIRTIEAPAAQNAPVFKQENNF